MKSDSYLKRFIKEILFLLLLAAIVLLVSIAGGVICRSSEASTLTIAIIQMAASGVLTFGLIVFKFIRYIIKRKPTGALLIVNIVKHIIYCIIVSCLELYGMVLFRDTYNSNGIQLESQWKEVGRELETILLPGNMIGLFAVICSILALILLIILVLNRMKGRTKLLKAGVVLGSIVIFIVGGELFYLLTHKFLVVRNRSELLFALLVICFSVIMMSMDDSRA